MANLRNVEDWSSDLSTPAAQIEWLVDANPKRPTGKAYARFEKYFETETVAEYLKAGGSKGDLKYDWSHGFLDLHATTKPAQSKKAKKEDVDALLEDDDDSSVAEAQCATTEDKEAEILG